MGAGDWIIATGQVKKMYARNQTPVAIVGGDGRMRWSEIFDNNPKIARELTRKTQRLVNGPNARPYIAAKTPKRWIWRPFQMEPGEVYLTQAERDFAAPYAGKIMVEPNVKGHGHRNKEWPFDRWQRVVDLYPDAFVQCGAEDQRSLAGVKRVITPTFRHACAVLSVSRVFLGTEGGLHHAAAALGIPAIVLFSEFIAPDVTGYPGHVNIRRASATCGSRVPCTGCTQSMEEISVADVVGALEAYEAR